MDHGLQCHGAINNFSGPAELRLPPQPPQRESGWELGAGSLGLGLQDSASCLPHATSLLQPPLTCRAHFPKCKSHLVPLQGLPGISRMKSQFFSPAFKALPTSPASAPAMACYRHPWCLQAFAQAGSSACKPIASLVYLVSTIYHS